MALRRALVPACPATRPRGRPRCSGGVGMFRSPPANLVQTRRASLISVGGVGLRTNVGTLLSAPVNGARKAR